MYDVSKISSSTSCNNLLKLAARLCTHWLWTYYYCMLWKLRDPRISYWVIKVFIYLSEMKEWQVQKSGVTLFFQCENRKESKWQKVSNCCTVRGSRCGYLCNSPMKFWLIGGKIGMFQMKFAKQLKIKLLLWVQFWYLQYKQLPGLTTAVVLTKKKNILNIIQHKRHFKCIIFLCVFASKLDGFAC